MAIVAAMPALARPEAAKALVERMVSEINAAVASDRSRDGKVGEVERILNTFTDLDVIARSTLGPPARAAKPRELRAYRDAFRGYLARKYTPRFEEFFGGVVTVTDSSPWKSYFQVRATARISRPEPYDVVFMVSTRSGRPLIFDIIVSGVSILKTEALEVRGLLDRARGDLGRLTVSLQTLD